MAAPLVASLELTLQDKLSAGLDKIERQLRALRDSAASLGMSELAAGIEKLRTGGDPTSGLTRGLRNAAEQADSTAAAIRRVSAANDSLAKSGRLGAAAHNVYRAGQHFSEAAAGGIGGLMSAGTEAFAVYEPVKMYAERDAILRKIAMMDGLSGPALEVEVKRLNTLVNTDAMETRNPSTSVADALLDLKGQGLSRTQAETVLRAHSEAATAYGISPALLGPVTGSIVGNLGIEDRKGAEGALAAVAYATQHGRVKMEDFSRGLPGLTGVASSLGMKGRSGLDTILAGAELSAKLASDGTQANVNLDDLLAYITSNREDNVTRKRAHIDLPALLLQGEKQGKSAFDVYLDFFKKNTAGKSPIAQSEFISSMVGQKQARDSLLALIQHNAEFEQLRKTLEGIDALKLKIDLASVIGSPEKQLENTGEALHQIGLTLGEGFLPALTLVNRGLVLLNNWLTRLNTTHPQALHALLAITAGVLAFGAALTVLGVIAPVVTAGWGLLTSVLAALATALGALFSPIGLVVGAVVALGAAAYDVYAGWSRFEGFFAEMWGGVRGVFDGFITFVGGAFTLDLTKAMDGLHLATAGLSKIFEGAWGAVKTVFGDFLSWVDGWSGGLGTRILAGVKLGWQALVDGFREQMHLLEAPFTNGLIGRMLHLGDVPHIAVPPPPPVSRLSDMPQISGKPSGQSATASAPAQGMPGTPSGPAAVHVTVAAEPGTKVTSVTSSSPNTTVTGTPNPGRTLNRP